MKLENFSNVLNNSELSCVYLVILRNSIVNYSVKCVLLLNGVKLG